MGSMSWRESSGPCSSASGSGIAFGCCGATSVPSATCGGITMSPGDVALILFGTFAVLILLRVPVAFALGLACLPVMAFNPRLTPILMMGEMTKAYNAFILLAVPFFLLSANIMNAAGITDRLVDLTKCLVGQFRGALAYINVLVSMIFAGISGSSTADAAGEGSIIIPAMEKQGYDKSFTVAITACSSV